jgi:hypothetical protein
MSALKYSYEELEELKKKIMEADEDKWYQLFYYFRRNLPKKSYTTNSNGLIFDLMKFNTSTIDEIKKIIG